MRKYRLTPQAEDDLWRIYHWEVTKYGEIQADKYHYNFLDQFYIIAEQPYLFSIVENLDREYRSCPCGSDIIYYQVNEQTVDIIRILGRQDLNKHL